MPLTSKLDKLPENPLANPVQDSPTTPKTPFSPVVISASLSAAGGTSGGRWTKHVFRSEPLYSPPSVEVAKRFLRSVGHSRRKSVSDTPVTSKPGASVRMSRLAQCHGCHGWLGGGLHVGSAIGKNVCTFQHSSLCRGGIVENDSWKACPTDFVPTEDNFGGAPNLIPDHFTPLLTAAIHEHLTPQPLDPNLQPQTANGQSSQEFGIQEQYSSQYARDLVVGNEGTDISDVLRLQRQANGEGARSKVIQERLPGRVWFGDEMLPAGMEQAVTDHRSSNQHALHESQYNAPLHGITITDIRNVPGLRDNVELHLVGIKDRTPVLSSAPSAPPPGLSGGPPAPPLANAFFPHQWSGDGIRVTLMGLMGCLIH